MKMDNKNPKMKKIIFANNIFIALQIVMLVLSIVLNFICDDVRVFLTIFVHVGLFSIFNIVVENIANYGYIMKKYEKIYQTTNSIRFFLIQKRIYQSAKDNQDKITTTLILQTFVKAVILVINFVLMLFMVNFE